MSIKAAENHYNLRVQIGHPDRAPNWTHGSALLWDKVGNGCLVRPQIVLTALSVWKSAENNRYGYEPLVKSDDELNQNDDADEGDHSDAASNDESIYRCKLGQADEERDLAGLILDKPFRDAKGNELTNFPEIAETPPSPGQVLCVLSQQYFSDSKIYGETQNYICFIYGTVCLLRGKKNVLYGLSGIQIDEQYVGASVFDENGKIYGVVTKFLYAPKLPEHGGSKECFVVFTPIYKFARKILRLPAREPKKSSK
jgi:hypothetical protein